MEIKRAGSQPSGKGPAEWFTGTVRIDPLFQATEPARAAGNRVTFEPGARNGIRIHSGRLWSSRPAAGGRSVGAGLLRKSDRMTWSGFRPARSIGMGQRPRRQ
jgi:hypothetical protein